MEKKDLIDSVEYPVLNIYKNRENVILRDRVYEKK